jgi:hypothetical protein
VNAATLAIAIIGAATGLAALTAQVWQTAVSGPRVKVSASNAVSTGTWLVWLSIDLTNVGRLPVTVSDVGVMVEVPGKEWQKMPYAAMQAAWRSGPELPHRLIDGESVTFFLDPAAVAAGLAEEGARMDVRCYAKLATGKTLYSSPRSERRMDVAVLAESNARRGPARS